MPGLGRWQSSTLAEKKTGGPMQKQPASQQDPRETPLDDPRQQTDSPTHKQTDKPWKGNPEKEQIKPDRGDIDLERWQESDTH